VEPALILWDFGDTLADERWMLQSPEGVPQWSDAYRAHIVEDTELIDAWSAGTATAEDVAGQLAPALGFDVATTLKHMRDACRRLHFFAAVMQSVRARRQRGLAQAIVTVNADVFSDVVVGEYGLADLFDTIVNSCHFGTADKVDLCAIAMEHLGHDIEVTMLIDNIADNVRRFEERGGAGYLFTNELAFRHDLATGVLPASLR
jgi:FMN phosphatase YigB (HAD superfamily)